MAFNLNDYEDVATLNKWFIENFPMGRSDINVVSHDPEKGYILIRATLWRDAKDLAPAVSNLAFGSRETYIQNMKKFYVEDTATSALGRAIILLKGADKTATKDDMQKVAVGNQEQTKPTYGPPGSRAAAVAAALRSKDFSAFEAPVLEEPAPVKWSVDEVVDAIGASIPAEPPVCCNAGHTLKQGMSKGGKPYYGYVCKANIKEHANWATITSNGKWYFKGGE